MADGGAQMNTIAELQDTLDEHKEALGDGAYVQLCDGLKRLHSLTDLYNVRYCQVDLEDHEDGPGRPGLSHHTASCIMRAGTHRRATWYTVFQQYTLPVDLTCLKLHEPVFIGNHSVRIVMSVEPYLKREQEMTAVAVLSGQ